MNLPAHVHDLALEVTFEGRELVLHPSAIETERGLLLLDVGFPDSLDQLDARLGEAGFPTADVALVLCTHQDGDHCGGLSTLQERTEVTTFASEHAAAVVDGREPTRGSGERYPPARVDVELAGSVTFNTRAGPAEVVPTPGHTPGHVSLYLPDERLLIAADALTAGPDGLAGPRPDVTEDLRTATETVGHLADLDVEGVLCYHGGFVAADSDRLAEIAAERE